MELASVVVIPARDEEARIAACLEALARQTVGPETFETIIVVDDCSDDTEGVALRTAQSLGLRISLRSGSGVGSGGARRIGMDAAARRLLGLGREQGLIACTDADSRPAEDWLERQLDHLRHGALVIAGLIELDEEAAGSLPEGVLRRRERDAARRLERVRESDPAAAHHHFAGASLAVTAGVYRDVGGLEPVAALEDATFEARLRDHGIPILRAADVRVRTSPRVDGRARRGLAVDIAVSAWSERRRYDASRFSLRQLAERKGDTTVTVIVPTKECAETIGPILRQTVLPLRAAGLIDEIFVIDAASADSTATVARAAGARVLQQDQVLPGFGPALGKGDAMWRAVSATGGDVVCFLDGDTANPDSEHLRGLLGPLLSDPSVMLVKGTFDRPLRVGEVDMQHEGGRVTELMARPLINFHEPRLAGFSQPLAGEFAARRGLLESIPFAAGYGVEIGIMVDALRAEGLDALAECHLGTRRNRHQPLRALGEMSYAVLAAVENRLGPQPDVEAGRYLRPWEQDETIANVPIRERPPLNTLRARDDSRPYQSLRSSRHR